MRRKRNSEYLTFALLLSTVTIASWSHEANADGGTASGSTESQITPYDFGAVSDNGVRDEQPALQAAINEAIDSGRPLDLCGASWRIDTPLYARGNLHIRNGQIRTSIMNNMGLDIGPAEGQAYVTPILENLSFYKIQKTGIVGLHISRGLRVQMTNVNFHNFRNGNCVAVALSGVQVLIWLGGKLLENDRHLAVYDYLGKRSTDIKVFGVFFQDSKSTQGHAGVSLYQAPGTSFTDCSFDVSRRAALVAVNDSWNVSFVNCRFEDSGLDEPGTHPAVYLHGGSYNIRFLANYFNNTQKSASSGQYPDVIHIGGATAVNLISNSFAAASPPVTEGPDYKAIMNTNLIDNF